MPIKVLAARNGMTSMQIKEARLNVYEAWTGGSGPTAAWPGMAPKESQAPTAVTKQRRGSPAQVLDVVCLWSLSDCKQGGSLVTHPIDGTRRDTIGRSARRGI
ncbi:TPA: hypothetical protein ACH3X1_004760 [Trebouxia sp. C0004]